MTRPLRVRRARPRPLGTGAFRAIDFPKETFVTIRTLLAALAFTATGLAQAQGPDAGLHLSASGDGEAKLTLHNDGVSGVLRAQVQFSVGVPVKDSTEAHKTRSFTGELRIDGKPCADARGRVKAFDGAANGEASTSCSVGTNGDKVIAVTAVVTKVDGIDAEDVKVLLSADKLGR